MGSCLLASPSCYRQWIVAPQELEGSVATHSHGRKAPSFLCVFLCQWRPLWRLDPLLRVAQIVAGVSAISSSLCRIMSRSTVYLGTGTATMGSRKQHMLPLDLPPQPGFLGAPCQSLYFYQWPSCQPPCVACVYFCTQRRGTEQTQSKLDNWTTVAFSKC